MVEAEADAEDESVAEAVDEVEAGPEPLHLLVLSG